MSQLSLDSLILNRNQVKIDESYLEKCTKNQSQHDSDLLAINMNNRVLSSKEIKINRNFLVNRKKLSSPESTRRFNQTDTSKSRETQETQKLCKIELRLNAFEENMKRMEARFGKQFYGLHEEVFKKKDSNFVKEDLKNVRKQLNEAKKDIRTILNTISAKNVP